jgi:hypothetical protein
MRQSRRDLLAPAGCADQHAKVKGSHESRVDQTPAHELHNPDLLAFVPLTASRLIEVGCSSGSLAREFKKQGGNGYYTGIELVPEYAELARRHCDRVLTLDIESLDAEHLRTELAGDCWIFGDTLEHLRDPWTLLGRI